MKYHGKNENKILIITYNINKHFFSRYDEYIVIYFILRNSKILS